MAYNPGGLTLNVQGVTFDNGQAYFSNANNISFGLTQNANTYQITASYSQSNQQLSLYAVSNTTQSSSMTVNASSINFAGAGIASVGATNGSVVISASTSQSNQQMSLYAASNTTQSSSMTVNASNHSFAGAGIASVGMTNGSVVISVPSGGGGGVDLAAGTQTATSGTIVFSNSNNFTFGMSNSSIITASYSQSNNNVSLYALGNTTQNSSTQLNVSDLSLNGLGNVTVGFSNGSIQISDSQSNNNVSLYALGNTTQNSSTLLNVSNLSFNGLGINTVGFSNGSIQISATAPSQSSPNVSLYGLGNTTQNSSTQLNASNLSFNGLGNVTVGFSNGSIQISDSQSNNNMSIYAVSNTTQSTSATANVSNLSFGGYGAASVGASNGSILVSVPSVTTLSRWAEPDDNFTILGATGLGSLSVQRIWLPFNVSASAGLIAVSISALTNTSATTASANNSLWLGVYTNNNSTLSLASSGSANNAFAFSQTGSTTANTSVNSVRQLTVPININATPGEYWIGAVLSQATTYTGVSMSVFGGSLIASGAALAPLGSNTSVGRPPYAMQGIYTAATSVGPSSINTNGLNFTSASNVERANIYVQIYNTTY